MGMGTDGSSARDWTCSWPSTSCWMSAIGGGRTRGIGSSSGVEKSPRTRGEEAAVPTKAEWNDQNLEFCNENQSNIHSLAMLAASS